MTSSLPIPPSPPPARKPRLNPSSFLLLGLIRAGVQSGYAIRRAIAQMRMDIFWATTHAQIYPQLARLEDGGYIARRDDPHGDRQRNAYSLTESGERAFLTWLGVSEQPPMELRDEGLLRLGFADALPPARALDLVVQLRKRAEEAEREFREEIIPVSESFLQLGIRFPSVVGHLGADYQRWAASRLAALEQELRSDPTFAARDQE
jgi:DNA-binding PadR family transcriptional regulator